jgi:hypothetical protein
MASSYSTDLKLELMVTGENAGTWGDKTNTNLNLIQQAIAGYESISIAGGAQTTTLTMDNAALSNARNIVIKLSGTITGNQIVTIPNGIEKTWIVSNGTVGAFTVEFKYASTGTGQTWSATDKTIKILYADGTDIQVTDLSTLSGEIATAQLENLAVTSAKLASFAVITARLATDAVTGVKIAQSTITQSKLAANSVGSNQLISTGVVAGSYTLTSLTVDADGRITSASSGVAGAGMEIPTRYSVGPTSGTHTAQPTANRLGVYMTAGAGGGGGGSYLSGGGGAGGASGFGFFNKPITQPFAQPFSVGGIGNTSGLGIPTGSPGGSGGNTTIANVGTVNGGGGGLGGPPSQTPGATGSTGTAPGASLTYPVRRFIVGGNFGNVGNAGSPGGGNPNPDPEGNPFLFAANPGNAGNVGVLVVFENTGT